MTDEPTILVRDLIAAGVEASLIARVSVLAARVADLDRRRAADADRQRRRRSDGNPERHVSHVTSRDPSDVTPRAYTSPQESSKPKKVSRSACELPSDWFSIDCLNFAEGKGWSREKIDAEAERFADHARAKGRRAKDWFAAWRNWVTSPYQNTQPKGSVNGQGPRTLASAADDLIARAEEREQQERDRAFDQSH